MHELEAAGHAITRVDAQVDPQFGLLSDYLASYRTPLNSVMSAEQPLRLYRHPTRGRFPVLLGLFGSRARTRFFLAPPGASAENLSNAEILHRAAANPLPPSQRRWPSKRNLVEEPDVRSMLPALTHTACDPGPTVTLGLVYAVDAATGVANCSVHRITLKRASIAIAIHPRCDLQRLIDAHVARGVRLPVSVNIGMDPAIYIAGALSAPAVQFGEDELGVAGAIRARPVEIAPCYTNGAWFVDHAEIVMEATLGAEREPESDASPCAVAAFSMPEYLGYRSPSGEASTMRVSAMSYRTDAIYQAVTGPGREQAELLGAGQEAALRRAMSDRGYASLVRDIVAQAAGGGHLLTVLQVSKQSSADDERARMAAEAILEDVSTTKNIVLVDEDVNPCSVDDVLWALSTRFRAEMDVRSTGLLRGTPLDPTQSTAYSSKGADGFTNKSVIDCSVPFDLRARFRRAFA